MDKFSQGAERDIIERKFIVGIAQQSADSLAQFRGPSIIRAAKESASIIIIGVQIVPNQRLASQNTLQLLNVFEGDLARDNFGAGLKDINIRQ